MKFAPLFFLILFACDDPEEVKAPPPLEVIWMKPIPGVTTSASMSVAQRDIVIHLEGRKIVMPAASATFFPTNGVLTKVVLRRHLNHPNLASALDQAADYAARVGIKFEKPSAAGEFKSECAKGVDAIIQIVDKKDGTWDAVLSIQNRQD
jgi:hypothetical protein